jgi:transposase
MGQAPAALRRADAATVAQIAQDANVARVIALVRRFVALVRERPAHAAAVFDAWLADVRASGVRAVQTFAAGLEQDGAAVRAALTTPWSNAQSEGHVTKLKLLKRQMYGRANFALLRRRVLLAA